MLFLLSWGVAVLNAGHYILFKFGLMSLPDFRRYPRYWEPWLGGIFRWKRTLRVRFAERCPASGPVVFAANHAKLDDPLFLWGAIDRATAGRLHIYFMMRDDFFRGWPWDYLPFSLNELTQSAGCIQISRDQISLGQLKPLLNVLLAREAFLMFPGRTRSRGGLCIEYREGIEEPGGVSFFLAHASRRLGENVPAVPMTRTHNPVTGASALVFGEPRCLHSAGRDEQRNFDLDLAVAISNLTEVHALHVLSVLLYLHCLHGRHTRLTIQTLSTSLSEIFTALPNHRLTSPDAIANPREEVEKTVQWLERARMLRRQGELVIPDSRAILAVPELNNRYRKRNPVRYYANQVLHFADVVSAVEDQVLGNNE